MSDPISNKKISIEDVARRAKVSITTVSRVINNFPTVTAKNRAKVDEAIAALKFKPNVSAQRLARGMNTAVGLVIPGYPGIFYSFYAIELIRGVGHACEILKLDLVFHISNGMNPINTNAVGGIIFADIIENRKQVEAALSLNIPCIVINNKVTDLDISYIAIDNVMGGEIATDYLTGLGHKKIATITGGLNNQSGLQRFEGYKNILNQKKLDCPDGYVYQGDYSRRSARLAMEQFLAQPDPPTAVFAASDDMALEAIAVVLERGMKVPEDISVIGFDDNPACLYGPVAVTTIKQPLFKMAEQSVRNLNTLVLGKDKKKHKVVLPPELIVRESCAAPKK